MLLDVDCDFKFHTCGPINHEQTTTWFCMSQKKSPRECSRGLLNYNGHLLMRALKLFFSYPIWQ